MIFRTASLRLAHDHERVARSNLRAETLAVQMSMRRRATGVARPQRRTKIPPWNDKKNWPSGGGCSGISTAARQTWRATCSATVSRPIPAASAGIGRDTVAEHVARQVCRAAVDMPEQPPPDGQFFLSFHGGILVLRWGRATPVARLLMLIWTASVSARRLLRATRS